MNFQPEMELWFSSVIAWKSDPYQSTELWNLRTLESKHKIHELDGTAEQVIHTKYQESKWFWTYGNTESNKGRKPSKFWREKFPNSILKLSIRCKDRKDFQIFKDSKRLIPMSSFSRTYRGCALPKQRSNPQKEDPIRDEIKDTQPIREDTGTPQMVKGGSRMTVVPNAERNRSRLKQGNSRHTCCWLSPRH